MLRFTNKSGGYEVCVHAVRMDKDGDTEWMLKKTGEKTSIQSGSTSKSNILGSLATAKHQITIPKGIRESETKAS